jgi:hypothetical protein
MKTITKFGQGNTSDTLPIQNGTQQDNTLSPLPFNFALEYAIENVKVTRKDKLNETHQLQTNADYVNLFRSNITKRKKRTEDLLICGDDRLKVNADKTKYVCKSTECRTNI